MECVSQVIRCLYSKVRVKTAVNSISHSFLDNHAPTTVLSGDFKEWGEVLSTCPAELCLISDLHDVTTRPKSDCKAPVDHTSEKKHTREMFRVQPQARLTTASVFTYLTALPWLRSTAA